MYKSVSEKLQDAYALVLKARAGDNSAQNMILLGHLNHLFSSRTMDPRQKFLEYEIGLLYLTTDGQLHSSANSLMLIQRIKSFTKSISAGELTGLLSILVRLYGKHCCMMQLVLFFLTTTPQAIFRPVLMILP